MLSCFLAGIGYLSLCYCCVTVAYIYNWRLLVG